MAATMANSSNEASAGMMPSIVGVGSVNGGNNKNNNGQRGPGGGSTAMSSIGSKPTLIRTSNLCFLIMDAPRQSNLHLYIKECRRNDVTDIVRVCEPTYHGGELTSAGISLHEMAYEDGHSPPEPVLDRWLALVEDRFMGGGGGGGSGSGPSPAAKNKEHRTIAVHCVAGLGRAPVLVAIALMEFDRMDAVEAVMMIRSQRRGAINEKQLQYLEGYKCRKRAGGGGCACVIM
mmetsp:Transcript_23183/g.55921  ORF Transcript_23183/g.55921 Transcript_23183/m.55921 type:complete len:232 (-) Transcript_23183:362-1057(-)